MDGVLESGGGGGGGEVTALSSSSIVTVAVAAGEKGESIGLDGIVVAKLLSPP
jgi:hypothetical protein